MAVHGSQFLWWAAATFHRDAMNIRDAIAIHDQCGRGQRPLIDYPSPPPTGRLDNTF